MMGILNVTPDSFYDGGKHISLNFALKQCEKMIDDGADIIDIGGQSTRPGSKPISEEEELSRVIPIIEQVLLRYPDIYISIDTNKAKVASYAVKAGACIVNDISAGDDDEAMIETVATLNVPYIFMHKQGSPEYMQLNPTYKDVVYDVFDYLNTKKSIFQKRGIADVIADVGFGFGKTIEHNYSLAAHIDKFKMLNCPILIGVSRKGMIYKTLHTSAEDALIGTNVLHALLINKIPAILRVHDVKEAKQTIKIIEKYNLGKE